MSFLKIRKTTSWDASWTPLEVVLGARKWYQSMKKWVSKLEFGKGAMRLPIFIDFIDFHGFGWILGPGCRAACGGLWRAVAACADGMTPPITENTRDTIHRDTKQEDLGWNHESMESDGSEIGRL